MTLYEKYIQQKEKYTSVFKEMKVFYNKQKNSISYVDGNGEEISVQYSKDMTRIDNVFIRQNVSRWKCFTTTFQNLGSEKWYFDFSEYIANPFHEVVPLQLSAMETQGLFDVMMELAHDYIRQENLPVILGVKYEGYGYSGTPSSIARKQSEGLRDKEYPYNPNILYTKEYLDKQFKNGTLDYLKWITQCRTKHGRTKYLNEIQQRIIELEKIKPDTQSSLDEEYEM